MQNLISPNVTNPKHLRTNALTDVSFVKWTSNRSDSNLIIVASHVFDFIDLYGFNKCGYSDRKDDIVKRVDRFQASARISCFSDARRGIIAYGCKNGKYGLLEVKSTTNGKNLLSIGKLKIMGNTYITAVDLKDDYIFIGTQNGKLVTENIKYPGSRKVLTEHATPLKAIYAPSPHLCLVGHDSGCVSLWDLRDREENVFNFNVIKNYRTSYKMTDNVRTCHMKNDFLAIVGTLYGHVKLIDMRYSTQKYPCALKVSKKSVAAVCFAENHLNLAFVACYEGYLEIKNDVLTSLWFNDDELDVPPWLKGNHYDKLQTSWSCELNDLVAFDNREDKIVVASNAGELCFINT